jgi:hypothetical protein
MNNHPGTRSRHQRCAGEPCYSPARNRD